MSNTVVRFVSLGFGTVTQVNMIFGVMRVNTAQAQRLLREAKEENRYLDWTSRRPTKTILLMTNGMVIGSPFRVDTIYSRLVRATTDNTAMQSAADRPEYIPEVDLPPGFEDDAAADDADDAADDEELAREGDDG